MANETPALVAAYLLNGDDELKKKTLLQRLIKRVGEKGDLDFNTQVFQAADIRSAEDLIDACETIPFASPVRLVVVKDAEKLGKPVVDAVVAYLGKPAPGTVLLMTATKLAANSRLLGAVKKIDAKAVIDCSARKRYELPKLIRDMALSHRVTITADNAAYLVERVGTSTVALDTELQKLASYVSSLGRDTISRADIKKVVAYTAQVNWWEFVDAVGARDLLQVHEKLSHLSGESPTIMLSRCVVRLRELLRIKALQGRGVTNIAQQMKRPDWQVKPLVVNAGRYTNTELIALIEDAAQSDREMKSGADAVQTLDNWVIKACTVGISE